MKYSIETFRLTRKIPRQNVRGSLNKYDSDKNLLRATSKFVFEKRQNSWSFLARTDISTACMATIFYSTGRDGEKATAKEARGSCPHAFKVGASAIQAS